MSNKVTFGLQKVHIAFLNDDGPPPVYAVPVHIPGAVSLSTEPQGEDSTFYADDGPYFVFTSNNGYTGELAMALVPDAILAEMLGWTVDANGMLVEDASATAKEFAMMFEIQGDEKNRRTVFYRCKAARPSKEHNTKGESVEPAQDTLSITMLPVETSNGKPVKGVMELGSTNTAVYNAFFNGVILPGGSPVAVNKAALTATIALVATLAEVEYTSATWTALETALTAAQTINANVNATQSQVNEANVNLGAAILALVPA